MTCFYFSQLSKALEKYEQTKSVKNRYSVVDDVTRISNYNLCFSLVIYFYHFHFNVFVYSFYPFALETWRSAKVGKAVLFWLQRKSKAVPLATVWAAKKTKETKSWPCGIVWGTKLYSILLHPIHPWVKAADPPGLHAFCLSNHTIQCMHS